MLLVDMNGKAVCLLGYGKEGKATLAALREHAPAARITIADRNPTVAEDPALGDTPSQTGDAWLESLDRFDILIKSPGIPPQPLLAAVAGKTTTATRLFFAEARRAGATIIGITGTKGKSTTSSLIAAILRDAGRDARLVGNIGRPALADLAGANLNTIFVHELSSYQLQDMDQSPHAAVITSFFPEHLDYHGSVEAYLDAKCHIARFQSEEDMVFFCAASPGAVRIAQEGKGRKIPFGPDDAPVRLDETLLIGEHNLSNIAGACLAACAFGAQIEGAARTIRGFRGLPHRLEMVGRFGGIDWVDDAISTTPESAVAALRSLGNRVDTIILGGQDRGVDFAPLVRELMTQAVVRTAILFPDTGRRIRQGLERDGRRDITLLDASTMEDAVRIGAERTKPGSICLLSTASPSYNMFKNFEEKGDIFQRCVRSLGT